MFLPLRLISAALLLLNCAGSFREAHGAKILAITPLASPSHGIWNGVLLEALAKNGHEVTAVVAIPGKNMTGLTYHVIGGKFDDDDLINFAFISVQEHIDVFWDYSLLISSHQAQESTVKQFLVDSKETYDLILYEACASESIAGGLSKFKAPIVVVNAYADAFWSWDSMNVANYPSVYPQPMFSFKPQMNFVERVQNFLYLYYSKYTRSNYLRAQQEISKQIFGRKAENLREVEQNFDFMLTNTGMPGLDPSRILPANVKEVGCIQCRPGNASLLPKDVQDWLNSATEGFILFSLGTNVKSSKLPKERLEAILDVFSKVKVNILWKFETEDLPGRPANVKISKWLSQQDVLGHKNIRAFITHGGRLSIQESIYHGVPTFVIPFFADQYLNGEQMVTSGMGLRMNYAEFDIATFKNNIDNLIQNNKQFMANAKKLSQIAQDQPESALQRAVFWTEYVMRHKGAKHLRPPGQHLNWIQLHSLDVVAFLSTCIIVPSVLAILMVKRICYNFCPCSNRKEKVN